MQTVYIVTLWAGNVPAKKWKTRKQPEPLPTGTGVTFTSIDTNLSVRLIGNISIEEFESGKEEMQQGSGVTWTGDAVDNIDRPRMGDALDKLHREDEPPIL